MADSSEDHRVTSSPSSDHSQSDLWSSSAKRSSGSSGSSKENLNASPVTPLTKKKDSSGDSNKTARQGHADRQKTNNEIWVELSDAIKVVADGLRDGESHWRGDEKRGKE